MRSLLAAILVAIIVCPAMAWAGEPTPVVTVFGENGQSRMTVMGRPVGNLLRMPDGYPRGPLIEEESEERLGLASWTESEGEATGDQALLARKEAELERLRVEVDRLREATDTAPMISVNVEVLEVSLTKMRRLGFEAPASAFNDGFVAALKANNVARTLASPSVTSVSGQQASLFIGDSIPLPAAPVSDATVEYAEVGIGLDVTAAALGGNRVRLDVRPRISSMAEHAAIQAGGVDVPRIKVWQCNMSCELAFGETMLLPGSVQERIESIRKSDGSVVETRNEIATWVVVRAEEATAGAGREARVQEAPSDAGVK